jgi:hypothetical protein
VRVSRPKRRLGGHQTLGALFVLLIGLSFIGCKSALNPNSVSSEASKGQAYDEHGPPVIVTRDDPSLPDGCRPNRVARLVSNFTDGFNDGNEQRISRSLELTGRPGPGGAVPFSWYSGIEGSTQREGKQFSFYDQDELLSYLAERHKRGERLRPLITAVTGDGVSGVVGADLVLIRTENGLDFEPGGPQQLARVKSVIDCDARKIIRWVMSVQRTGKHISELRVCPKVPDDWKPTTAVIACAR